MFNFLVNFLKGLLIGILCIYILVLVVITIVMLCNVYLFETGLAIVMAVITAFALIAGLIVLDNIGKIM